MCTLYNIHTYIDHGVYALNHLNLYTKGDGVEKEEEETTPQARSTLLLRWNKYFTVLLFPVYTCAGFRWKCMKWAWIECYNCNKLASIRKILSFVWRPLDVHKTFISPSLLVFMPKQLISLLPNPTQMRLFLIQSYKSLLSFWCPPQTTIQ